jgi:hypothetical protein
VGSTGNAEVKSDAAILDGISAADWSAISTEGKVDTRAQALDNIKKSKFTRSEVSEMKVRVINPNVAVVTGVATNA